MRQCCSQRIYKRLLRQKWGKEMEFLRAKVL
jgi:hypothetical protein